MRSIRVGILLLATAALFFLGGVPRSVHSSQDIREACEAGTLRDIQILAKLYHDGTSKEDLIQRLRVIAAQYKTDKTYREALVRIIEGFPDRFDRLAYEIAVRACVALWVEDRA